jgi:hypothetical protein
MSQPSPEQLAYLESIGVSLTARCVDASNALADSSDAAVAPVPWSLGPSGKRRKPRGSVVALRLLGLFVLGFTCAALLIAGLRS